MDVANEIQVTQLLGKSSDGDQDATGALLAIVYGELRSLAGRFFRTQRTEHTLQPTALVHEAFLKLIGNQSIEWTDRTHFFRTAAKAMREILADHARRRRALKRGGEGRRLPLTSSLHAEHERRMIDAYELDEALTRLAGLSPRQAQIVELRFFGGLTVEETAQLLEVSPRTIELDWRTARAWLRHELERGDDRDGP